MIDFYMPSNRLTYIRTNIGLLQVSIQPLVVTRHWGESNKCVEGGKFCLQLSDNSLDDEVTQLNACQPCNTNNALNYKYLVIIIIHSHLYHQ